MYINFDILDQKKLEVEDLILLQMAKQNINGVLAKRIAVYPKTRISFLTDAGYLDKIKGKPKDTEESKIRLSKKGKKALEDIETPEVLPEDIILFDWMADVYTRLGKEIGNKKKTKMYIAFFRTHSGIEKNHLATLLEQFVRDDDNMEYNIKLEYAFFKPSNVFQVKFDLEQSRLYLYYLKRKDYFDARFKEIDKMSKNVG